MDEKKRIIGCFIFVLTLLVFSTSFVSAGWFSDDSSPATGKATVSMDSNEVASVFKELGITDYNAENCVAKERDATWENWEGLSTDPSAHPEIAAYRVRWFNGGWSGWFIRGENDMSSKYNDIGEERRLWSLFEDHHHEYIVCSKDGELKQCSESDSGREYTKLGYTTVGNLTRMDYCSGDYLIEFSCDGEAIETKKKLCELGCEDGTCLENESIKVDLKVNGKDSPNPVSYKSDIKVSWSTEGNIDYCNSFGNYVPLSGEKRMWADLGELPPSGSEKLMAAFADSGDFNEIRYMNELDIGIQCWENTTELGNVESVKDMVSVPVEKNVTESCVESDRGKNYYEKGKTTGSDVYGGNPDEKATYYDKCDGEERIMEFFCHSDGYVTMENKICENGCEDGACVEEQEKEISLSIGESVEFNGNDISFVGANNEGDITLKINGEVYTLGEGDRKTTSKEKKITVKLLDIVVNEYGEEEAKVTLLLKNYLSDDNYILDEPAEECFDKDKGKNYGVKGRTYDKGAVKPWTDACINESYLTEHWCGSDGRLRGGPHKCEGKCLDGVCVSDDYETEEINMEEGDKYNVRGYTLETVSVSENSVDLSVVSSPYEESDESVSMGSMTGFSFVKGETKKIIESDYLTVKATLKETYLNDYGEESNVAKFELEIMEKGKEQEENIVDIDKNKTIAKVFSLGEGYTFAGDYNLVVESISPEKNMVGFLVKYPEDYSSSGLKKFTLYEGDSVKIVKSDDKKRYIEVTLQAIILGELREQTKTEPVRVNDDEERYIKEEKAALKFDFVIKESVGSGQEEEENETIEQKCDNGCLHKGQCVPISFRDSGMYCSFNEGMIEQGIEGDKCSNNFECKSNVCANGECISQGFLDKVINWFSRMFGGR